MLISDYRLTLLLYPALDALARMNANHDKMIHLQLVLLGLIESPQVADPTRDLVEKASREHHVIRLLRDRCSGHPVFRSFDHVLGFDSLEEVLGEAIQNFLPRASRYGLRHSGLCLIAAAISHSFFAVLVRDGEVASNR